MADISKDAAAKLKALQMTIDRLDKAYGKRHHHAPR